MDLVTIRYVDLFMLFLVIYILLMKIQDDKTEREKRRSEGRHKAMLRRGWKVSPDSQDGVIRYYKPRRRKKRK